MQQITRRPQRKNTNRKRVMIANNRRKKQARRRHQRKMARKLTKMATLIDKGEYRGIANSPLLHLNWDYVIKRSLTANTSWKQAGQKG
jgi:hypothetical protein